jgi:hypothetical protein
VNLREPSAIGKPVYQDFAFRGSKKIANHQIFCPKP